MRILGLVFAGTSTAQRSEMTRFTRETLGLEQTRIGGVEADMFELPDGLTLCNRRSTWDG